MISEVQVESRRYTVVDDVTLTLRVLLVGRVVNDLTGRGLAHSLSTEPAGFRVRVVDGGWFAVSGYPEVAFPRLATSAYAVRLSVEAEGYAPASILASVPAGSQFPLNVPELRLRPFPVRLQGRVSDEDDPHPPIPGALVFAQDPGQHAVLLRRPIRRDRAVGTPVREVQFTAAPVVGPAKTLAAPAAPEATRVRLNDRQGVLAGRILRLGDLRLGELAEIQSVAPNPADLTLPGDVFLTLPLSRSFPAGAPCAELAVAVVNPPNKHLNRTAVAGEAVVVLDADLTASAIELTDGVHPSEYHDLGALTDAAGYYAADGFGGVVELDLNASAAGFTTPTTPHAFRIDYDREVNLADWRL